jgi:CubicO group peptidase (beta-lactamase class C family)
MQRTFFHMLTAALFACLVGAHPYAANAETAVSEKPPKTLAELKTLIETIRVQTHTPAVGIALVGKEGPLWVAGLGEANLEKHQQANENTMFRIASASKMFVGLAILKLVEEGNLHLDDKLRDVAPEVQFSNPWETTHPVRIAHLLEHTTGWDIRPSEYAAEAPDSMPLLEGLSEPMRTLARTSRWAPGTRHAYNNTGPVVAAYVVEKITHQKFEDFVRASFFNPMHMDSSTYYRTDKYLAQGATLYVGSQAQPYAQVYSRPSSSLNTSPKDMAQLLQLFINGGQVNGQSLLKPESIVKFQTPLTTLGAQQGLRSGYGLTLELSAHNNYPMFGHNGGLPGAITQFAYVPELQKGFVLMLNASNGEAYWKMSEAIKAYLFQEAKKPLPVAIPLPEKFRQLDGIYARVNPDAGMFRLMSDLTEAITVSHTAERLTRSSLFGNWSAEDFAVNDHTLVSPNSGLPTTAIVDDPVLGQTVQAGGATYQRVSAAIVFARLGLFLCVALLSLGAVVFALVWIPRRIWGKLPAGAAIQVRLWPLLATGTLVCIPLALAAFGADVLDIARLSYTSGIVFVLSLLYPMLALYSLWVTVKHRAAPINPWVRWTSGALALSHVGFAALLAGYGLLGLRLWA